MMRIPSNKLVFWAVLVVLFVFTSVMPSVARAAVVISDSVSQEEIDALLWIKESTPGDAVVLSTIAEGNLVSAIAERKNVADNDFILIRDSSSVFEDVELMYTSIFKTKAVELLNKYDVDYIYFSPRAQSKFNITELKYAEEDCFELVYDEKIQIYRSFCKIKPA